MNSAWPWIGDCCSEVMRRFSLNDDGIVVRAQPKLLKRINAIWVVQSPLQKYFASPVGQIISTNSRHPTPPEGRIMIVTDAGWGAVDAAAAASASGAQRGCRAVGQNRPFAHSGRFCGHKST